VAALQTSENRAKPKDWLKFRGAWSGTEMHGSAGNITLLLTLIVLSQYKLNLCATPHSFQSTAHYRRRLHVTGDGYLGSSTYQALVLLVSRLRDSAREYDHAGHPSKDDNSLRFRFLFIAKVFIPHAVHTL
jgi:hypothetical protein